MVRLHATPATVRGRHARARQTNRKWVHSRGALAPHLRRRHHSIRPRWAVVVATKHRFHGLSPLVHSLHHCRT